MLGSRIILDLPSESTARGGTFWSRLRQRLSMAQVAGPQAGTESLTLAGTDALRRLLWGVDKAGFEDIVCAVTEDQELWLDQQGGQPDLEELVDRIETSGVLDRGFDTLRVVVSRRVDGLHCLVAMTVQNQVPMGQPEFSAQVSARFTDLRIQRGESPLDYRARIEAFMADPAPLDQASQRLRELTLRLARDLEHSMGGHLVSSEPEPVSTRIVVPGPDRVARFDGLTFGDDVPDVPYRAHPGPPRSGAYDDPHEIHFPDPYHDVLCWIMTRAVVDKGLWRRPDVKLVHPRGVVLATASDPESLARVEFDVPSSAVTFGESEIATSFGT